MRTHDCRCRSASHALPFGLAESFVCSCLVLDQTCMDGGVLEGLPAH